MRSYLLSDLRLRCQQRCDKENDPQIATAEWNRLISEMYGELYSIVEKAGMRYFESTQTIIANGSFLYSLDTAHLATIYVAQILNPNDSIVLQRLRPLRRLNAQERYRWVGQTGDARRYELAGTGLGLYPAPPSGQQYEHKYMPQAPDLSTAGDSTSVDLVQADGEALLVWGVVVKAMAKSESDVQLAIAEREGARGRFAEWCALRSFNESPRVFVDDSYDDDDNGYPREGQFWWNR